MFMSMLRAMGYTPVEAADEREMMVILDETTATQSALALLPEECPILVLCRSDSVPKAPDQRLRLLPRPFTMAELSSQIAELVSH